MTGTSNFAGAASMPANCTHCLLLAACKQGINVFHGCASTRTCGRDEKSDKIENSKQQNQSLFFRPLTLHSSSFP